LELGASHFRFAPGLFFIPKIIDRTKNRLVESAGVWKIAVMSTAQHSHYRRRTRKNRLYIIGFVLLVVLVIGLLVGLLLLMNSPALDWSR
jgi:quinol-cytochrome oxidoreductase complex cytochrome b subunit